MDGCSCLHPDGVKPGGFGPLLLEKAMLYKLPKKKPPMPDSDQIIIATIAMVGVPVLVVSLIKLFV